MNRIQRVAILTVFGIALAWSAGIAAAATAAAASNGVCPPLTGVKWVAPYSPYPSGTAYTVHVKGSMTCAKAVLYVKKLVARHVRTNQPFAGGPSGWTCKAEASKSGLAYVGGCNPKKEGSLDPSDFFTWTV